MLSMLKQEGDCRSRRLTEDELQQVYTTKASRMVWKICRACGRLQLVGAKKEYCNSLDCAAQVNRYKSLNQVTVREMTREERKWAGHPKHTLANQWTKEVA